MSVERGVSLTIYISTYSVAVVCDYSNTGFSLD